MALRIGDRSPRPRCDWRGHPVERGKGHRGPAAARYQRRTGVYSCTEGATSGVDNIWRDISFLRNELEWIRPCDIAEWQGICAEVFIEHPVKGSIPSAFLTARGPHPHALSSFDVAQDDPELVEGSLAGDAPRRFPPAARSGRRRLFRVRARSQERAASSFLGTF